MKSFNEHISEAEAIYPDSYLRNKRLMNLVKQHKDPFKFLLAVIDQMNRGKLHLKRIGAASTREVAALWNDHNTNKIPANMMESLIEQALMEGSSYHKGWVNKSKIIKHNKGVQPYHVQMLAKDPKKLGLSEKDIINHLTDRYDKMDAPEPKQSAIKTYRDIEQGHLDVDHEVEFLAMEKGWCRFMADECYPMLGGSDWKHLHAAAKKLSDAYPEIFFFDGCSQRQLSGELHLFTDKGASSRNWAFTVETFTAWVEGKNPDFRRVKAPKRTEIGATMAMFRGD